jgi:hypothetical protein
LVTFDDPDEVARAIQGQDRLPNLGVLLHPKMGSPLVCFDIDGVSPGTQNLLQRLEISKTDDAWMQQTGRGPGYYHAFYYYDGDPLPRRVKATQLPIDLLSNGYSIVSPSNTYLWRDQAGRPGGTYKWLPGHSPSDIPVSDLQPLSDLALKWWRKRTAEQSTQPSEPTSPARGKAWKLLREPIRDGGRNDSLTRIAGWLRHYHPLPVVQELVLAVNAARCEPPLEVSEVVTIVKSVFNYPQAGVNGHPRAYVPGSWQLRKEGLHG